MRTRGLSEPVNLGLSLFAGTAFPQSGESWRRAVT